MGKLLQQITNFFKFHEPEVESNVVQSTNEPTGLGRAVQDGNSPAFVRYFLYPSVSPLCVQRISAGNFLLVRVTNVTISIRLFPVLGTIIEDNILVCYCLAELVRLCINIFLRFSSFDRQRWKVEMN